MIDLIWKADSLHLGARYCQISKSDHKQFTRLIVLLFSSGSPIVVVGFFSISKRIPTLAVSIWDHTQMIIHFLNRSYSSLTIRPNRQKVLFIIIYSRQFQSVY